MVVTPFGDLVLDDEKALAMWIDAHARRHGVYSRLLQMGGGQTLRGTIDGDWMHRHWSRHVALATYTALDLSGLTQGLALPGKWKTQRELIDWHELRDRIHLKQDRQLKLATCPEFHMAGAIAGLHVFAGDVGPEPLSLLDGNYTALTTALNSLQTFANSYVDSGAVNGLVVSVPAPQVFAYSDGIILQVKVAATNTTATPTINVNGLGAKAIVN